MASGCGNLWRAKFFSFATQGEMPSALAMAGSATHRLHLAKIRAKQDFNSSIA